MSEFLIEVRTVPPIMEELIREKLVFRLYKPNA